MKTLCNINIYGLDPQVWDTFRAVLHSRRESVSAWAIRHVEDEVEKSKKTLDNPPST